MIFTCPLGCGRKYDSEGVPTPREVGHLCPNKGSKYVTLVTS